MGKKINNNNYVEKSKKKIVVLGIVLIIFVIMLIGGTYALFTINKNGDKQNVIKAGDISMVLDESLSDGINIQNAYPMTDTEGKNQSTIYKFSIENNEDTDNTYEIHLVNTDISEDKTRISDSLIKYRLQKEGEFDNINYVSNLTNANDNSKILDTGTLLKGEKETYTIQVWIDESADTSIAGQVFGKQLKIDATQIVK